MSGRPRPELEKLLEGVPLRSFGSMLFNVANAYSTAAQDSWRRVSGGNADFAGPGIMCQAFAIELLLKFFIAVDSGRDVTWNQLKESGVNLRGHTYSSLFDRVSEEGQRRIAESCSSLAGVSVTPTLFRKKLIELGDEPFVGWRYVYENGGVSYINKKLLDQVTDALGLAAQAVRRGE